MKWTIGVKIAAGFGLLAAIFLVVGVVSYQNVNQLTDTVTRVDHAQHVLKELNGLLQGLTDAETGRRGYFITGEEPYLEPYQAGLAAVEQHTTDLQDLIRDNPIQQQRLTLLEQLVKQKQASLQEGVELARNQGLEAARKLVSTGKGKQEMDNIREAIAEMEEHENKLLKDRSEEAQASTIRTKLVILGGTLGAFAISAVGGVLITRNISKPLREITAAAERMAMGDLDFKISTNHRQDEAGILARAFTRMTDSLRTMAEVAERIADGDLRLKVSPQSEKDMLGNAFASMLENLQQITTDIAEGINVLSSSASEISTSTSQLSSGAAQTAVAVSQATATVEEVRQTAMVSNQKARQVAENAQRVVQTSLSGKKSTEDTIEGMQRIRQQVESIADSMARLSEQTLTIGQIIATVDDLAAQSNLLAVNASIEAAKAGEHGKGFTVVAQEVRSLAEQSKQATNQVRAILNDIQKATNAAVMATEQGSKAVEVGTEQAGKAGESILALSGSVTESAQAAIQIAASGQQQLAGVDQVASAMASIKQASTQNLASAKQLEAAAHDLKELGQTLKQAVK